MHKPLILCAALLLLSWAGTAEAKNYRGTTEDPPVNQETNDTDTYTGLDKASSDPITYNSDGTEREEWQKEDAARRRMNGERGSGPAGQENMFPSSGGKRRR